MRLPEYRQTMGEFERQIGEKDLVIWGKNKACPELCTRYGARYILDSNDELCDTKIGGIPVSLPEKIYGLEPSKTVVLLCMAESSYREALRVLDEAGHFTVFFWNVLQDAFLGEFSTALYDHMERIRGIQKVLWDDCSRKVLQEVVRRRICGLKSGYGDLKVRNEIQYIFPPALYSKREGVILDLGGYIGDSVDRFVNQLGGEADKIVTFEAWEENVRRLEEKRESLKEYWKGELEIVPCAVADRSGTVPFSVHRKAAGCFLPAYKGAGGADVVEQVRVEATTIDEVIPDTEKVRYIKMDIEGAEYAALMGARRTIMREKPGLAISIYHNACDYYRLAELILEYVPAYRLAVRHHKDRHVDTVLYAWIQEAGS